MQQRTALSLALLVCLWIFSTFNPSAAGNLGDAQALVEASFNYMRGKTSVSTVEMSIHRSDWERMMVIKGWTKGQQNSIFWIVSPPKDEGNSTLKRGREMWTYNPKVNRVIKLPPSMMSQAWMGSDFSNNDLAKSDSLLHDYTHTLIGQEWLGEHQVFVIRSLPKPRAPVVWGMQRLTIRADYIFLKQEFFDEDLEPVKILSTQEIEFLGGKLFPRVWKMQKADAKNEYTLLKYKELSFNEPLPDRLFTVSALKTYRP
jgi:outer membrane lipoprotein-sorting protein